MSGHGHSHGCGEHAHDTVSETELANQFSLYLKVATERVTCLNEMIDGSGKDVFKPWDRRLDTEKFVESDVDEELLFNIPFTGLVKLRGVIIVGGEGGYHPACMKLYKNRPNMTFDDTGIESDQEFDLQPDLTGTLQYSTKAARFNSVECLSIYFPRNFGEETTKVYYIGLRGDFTEAKKHGVTITTYEARANPSDHKTSNFDSVHHDIC